MDPAVQVAIISACSAVLVAVVAVYGSVITVKLREIHTLANDNLAKISKKLDEAVQKIASQAEMITELRNPSRVNVVTAAPNQIRQTEQPLPVEDDRTASASERVAEATERVAAATENTAKG